MSIFLNRILQREQEIKDWLIKNNLKPILDTADQMLGDLPREEITENYKKNIERALKHCVANQEIKALDFEWSPYGDGIDSALSYGFSDQGGEGKLSKTDLGPKELSGIEIDIERDNIVDDYFSELSVYVTIKGYKEKIKTPLFEAFEKDPDIPYMDAEDVIMDYFQIWNYKIGCEVCLQLEEDRIAKELKDRTPFWVTMTRHDRWSVPIMLIK